MRKRSIVVLAITLSVTLFGCGNKTDDPVTNKGENKVGDVVEDRTESDGEAEKETIALPDLTGQWVQEGKTETETHMVATIHKDGKMGAFFILEGDPVPWTYWVGTYEVTSGDENECSWTSQNTYAGNGLMASSDSSKEFRYKDNKLSCNVTIEGETIEVSFIRGDWDESVIPADSLGTEKASSADYKDLEIKSSSWCVNNGYLYYFMDLYNPNDEITVELPSIRITARDEAGVVLGTQDETLSEIYPGQDFCYGFQAFSVEADPATVDFEVLKPDDYNLKVKGDFVPLEVVNTAKREDKFVGEVNNPNDFDLDMVAVTVVGKDSAGNIVYINTTFVDKVESGKTVPFDISYYGKEEIADVEYYANQWL